MPKKKAAKSLFFYSKYFIKDPENPAWA